MEELEEHSHSQTIIPPSAHAPMTSLNLISNPPKHTDTSPLQPDSTHNAETHHVCTVLHITLSPLVTQCFFNFFSSILSPFTKAC